MESLWIPEYYMELFFFLTLSTGTIFAQESLISVQTDDNNYDEGDTIVVSGRVTTVVGETPVTLQLLRDESLIDIAQIEVAQDGSYSHTIIAEGPQWAKQGDYVVRVLYGEGNFAQTEFSFTPESEAKITTDNFEVDAGNYGTFDVEYTIKGGTVENMEVNSDNFSVIVEIESTDEGTITLDLPREFIGAEKQDGKDEIFIILIDEIETPYEEEAIHSESRKITINFEEGDSKIEIIGTYVVPEFGSIAIMIMVVGMMSAIILIRNKNLIKF